MTRPVTPPNFLSFSVSVRRARAVVILALLGPIGLFAAEEKQQHSMGEKAAEAFGKLQTIVREANPNWNAALDLLNGLIPTLGPESYDLVQALQTKGKLLLQKEEYSKAIEPLETALRIADAHQFFEPPEVLMISDLLARLYAQEASAAKTPAAQEPAFLKSITYLKRWMKESPKKSADMSMLYAQILVQYATVNPEKVNLAAIKEAKVEVENVLYTTVKPKETAYVLLQFVIQQEGNMEKSAEMLELMVSMFPTKANYWQTLMATYSSLAQANEKTPEKYRQYYIRAINTIERAQAYGFLKTPKDQFNLVTIYTIVGQFGRSTELLHTALRNGTIESDVKNWSQLAYAYQQAHRELEAINALKEGAKLFPKSGQIDFNIANIYYALDDMKNANLFFRSAIEKKGDLDPSKIYPTLRVIAFSSLELGQLEDALKAIQQAETMKEAAGDSSLPRMKEAVNGQIAERDEKKKEADAKGTAPKTP
jgi:tetratricopeptide (TPR) repeat protein